MGGRIEINETLTQNLALLAMGTGCVVTGAGATAFAVFAAPVAAVGAWSAAKFLRRMKDRDPAREKDIQNIMGDLNERLIGDPRVTDMDAKTRGQIDKDLAGLIARFWPTPAQITKLSGQDGGYPEAIACYMISEMMDARFRPKWVEDAEVQTYMSAVIEAALEAALRNKAYYETIEPLVAMETLGMVGAIKQAVTKFDTLPESVTHMSGVLDWVQETIEDIQSTVHELRDMLKEQDGVRKDNAALRGDIERYQKDLTRYEDRIEDLRAEVKRLMAENLAHARTEEGIGASDADDSLAETLANTVINPETESEKTAADYLMMDTPDLRKAIRALEQNLGSAEADFEAEIAAAKDKLIRKHKEIAAAAYYIDGPRAAEAYERIVELAPEDGGSWTELGLLQKRLGNLDAAMHAYEQVGRIGETNNDPILQAISFGNLGNVPQTRGDLDAAMTYYEKALALNEELGRKEGMASDYGNLGIVAEIRGDLDTAVTYHEKSLAIEEELGRKEGVASDYSNLGNVAQIRGDLEAAVTYFEKALALNEELGRKEGMAINYGNLGIVGQIRGDLDAAVTYHEKALVLNEELGRKEGMANNYGNLGIVGQTRGDLEAAVTYYEKSLALNEELGSKKGMASNYGNLGNVAQTRGDLEAAVTYYEKSLAIEEELGRKEGMASDYGNLGNVAQIRGDLEAAVTYYKKALALNEELGRKEGMAINYGNLGIVAEIRGDLDAARTLWEQALDLFTQVGAAPQIAQMQSLLDGLNDPAA